MLSYIDTVQKYRLNYCDKKGVCKDGNNLTEEEQAGLDEIKDGIKNKGWIIYNSDKSGKIVLDTKVNFLECMSAYYISDKVVTSDEVKNAE